jgi:hypothetical protein
MAWGKPPRPTAAGLSNDSTDNVLAALSWKVARLRDLVLAPIRIAALATEAKSFAHNPIMGSRLLNRWGLHEGRARVAAKVAASRRAKLSAKISAPDRENFMRDGFVIKLDYLPDRDFKRLRAEVFDCTWNVLEKRQGSTLIRRVPIKAAGVSASKPSLAKLISDETTIGIMRFAAAAKGQPRFSIQAVLTDPLSSDQDRACSVHSDSFHPVAKAWFFLNDVGPDDAPLFYVPGSHRLTAARAAWLREQSLTAADSHDDREALRIGPDEMRQVGLPEPVRLIVPANTLIVADVFGFHGRTPRRSATTRVEIFGSLRGNPFIPWEWTSQCNLRRIFVNHKISAWHNQPDWKRIDAPARI